MWYLHGKIKHCQLTWFSCDITCARTFDQGHTGQGEVRNSRPHHYHHQHQQTIVFFPLLCMLVSWFAGQQVWYTELWKGWPQSWLSNYFTPRPHPKNAKQSTSAARICVRSAESSSLMCNDGRLLTQRRREKIDIVTANSLGHIPTGHCMLAQQWFISKHGRLWSIFDDCFKFTYGVVLISRNWKWWPQRSPLCVRLLSIFLYLLPLRHEKSCFGWPPHSPPHCPS